MFQQNRCLRDPFLLKPLMRGSRAAHSEQNAVLRARDEALLALLIYAGLRVQEVCDMQLRDLDLEGGMLTVRQLGRRAAQHLRAEVQRERDITRSESLVALARRL